VVASRSAQIDGFSLHADTDIAAGDRDRLERVSRYMLRPPLAYDRFDLANNGKITYELKRPFSDGTTHIVFEPGELIEKLAALVPFPHKNLIRYHGVLAPNARWRRHVVPKPPQPLPLETPPDQNTEPKKRRRHPWSELMMRVFAIDVLACANCGGRMSIISTITDPAVIPPFLRSIGLPPHPPPLHTARAPPTPDWD